MNHCYTRSQQLAVLAAQRLAELVNQEPRDQSGEQPLREFFLACGVEPVPNEGELFQGYALTREQLRLIGEIPPERLPQLPDCPAQFSPLLACAAVGMVVVRAYTAGPGKAYTLGEVDEVRPLPGGGTVLRVGSSWFNQEGTATTAKGTPKHNTFEALEPVTPAVWEQLERQESFQKLTGYNLGAYSRGLLAGLPLGALRAMVALAEHPQSAVLLESLPNLFQLFLDTPPVSGAAFEAVDEHSVASDAMGRLTDAIEDGCAALAQATGLPGEQVVLMLFETVCQR
jgi:hypothetical protein